MRKALLWKINGEPVINTGWRKETGKYNRKLVKMLFQLSRREVDVGRAN